LGRTMSECVDFRRELRGVLMKRKRPNSNEFGLVFIIGCGGPQPAVLAAVERGGIAHPMPPSVP
jgi:hypothetical protein